MPRTHYAPAMNDEQLITRRVGGPAAFDRRLFLAESKEGELSAGGRAKKSPADGVGAGLENEVPASRRWSGESVAERCGPV